MKRQVITDALRIITTLALAFIAIYLVRIHIELQGIRREQVKSQFYALSPYSPRINDPKNERARRNLESSVNVEGSVSVNGDVRVQEPLEVTGSVDVR